jgi:hypothetical protein
MNELGPMIHDERMAHKAAVCKHLQVYTNTYTCIFGGRGVGGAVPGEGPRTKAHGPRGHRPGGLSDASAMPQPCLSDASAMPR